MITNALNLAKSQVISQAILVRKVFSAEFILM